MGHKYANKAHPDWLRLAVLPAMPPGATAAPLPPAHIAALGRKGGRSGDCADGLLIVRPLGERRTAAGDLHNSARKVSDEFPPAKSAEQC